MVIGSSRGINDLLRAKNIRDGRMDAIAPGSGFPDLVFRSCTAISPCRRSIQQLQAPQLS